MSELSKDVIQLLQYLLPGFLVAWVYYGLTAHRKPSQFERVIQALIFTLLVRALVTVEKWSLEWVGQSWAVRPWDTDADLVSSFATALVLGVCIAYAANNDYVHRLVRRLGVTKQTSRPSEWFDILSDRPAFVVLHMEDDRRLYGWPQEWPADPKNGHFYITQPSWLRDEDAPLELAQLDGLLINVRDVKWVELMRPPEVSHGDKEPRHDNYRSANAPGAA